MRRYRDRLTALVAAAIASLAGVGEAAQDTDAAPQPRPVLEIPKATYALGEKVFYWVGVKSDAPMSREAYEPCEETVVGPGGDSTSRPLEWPLDGFGDYGWRGGSGLAAHETIVGTYQVRVTCADETVTGGFEVEPFAPVDDFGADFAVSDGCNGRQTDHRVSLSVRNYSADHDAYVATPGSLSSPMVWFSTASGPPERASCHSSFPETAFGLEPPRVGSPLYFDLTPENLESVPHVVLTPGQGHQWSFCLSQGVSCFDDSFPDSVALGAVLHVLFRPAAGAGDYLGPMRIPVSGEFSLRGERGEV
jgi:hypothetical protein